MVGRKLLVKFQRKYELKNYSFTYVNISADHNFMSVINLCPILGKYSSSFTETLDL